MRTDFESVLFAIEEIEIDGIKVEKESIILVTDEWIDEMSGHAFVTIRINSKNKCGWHNNYRTISTHSENIADEINQMHLEIIA